MHSFSKICSFFFACPVLYLRKSSFGGGTVGKGEQTRQRVYDFVCEYLDCHGYAPSVREICLGVNLKSPSSAFGHLRHLAEEGRIEFNPGQKRSISLPGRAKPSVRIPVLGRVTAGLPILAVEQCEETLPVDPGFVRSRELFALRVQGDSMQGAAILNGDLVIVERTPQAQNGDIVVALLGEEATVKRFFREADGFRLQPENDAYEPIFTRELVILGRVVAVFRDQI